jgi:hypothetical protein
MMSDPTNPFAALSLIVAPAVLTNASSILILSTSNRLARAVDRARALATQLEAPVGIPGRFTALRLNEMDSSERRALMLLSALRLFYASLGAFAGAALTSLLRSRKHSSRRSRLRWSSWRWVRVSWAWLA